MRTTRRSDVLAGTRYRLSFPHTNDKVHTLLLADMRGGLRSQLHFYLGNA